MPRLILPIKDLEVKTMHEFMAEMKRKGKAKMKVSKKKIVPMEKSALMAEMMRKGKRG
jgi:hypothetical protein